MLEPGMKVRIASRLVGSELYDADDPKEYEKWLGKEVTVRCVQLYRKWMVGIEEDHDLDFYMEEIDCIVEDAADIEESDASLDMLFGGVI